MKPYAGTEAERHGHGIERRPSRQPERRNVGRRRTQPETRPPAKLRNVKMGTALAPGANEGLLRLMGEAAAQVRGKDPS